MSASLDSAIERLVGAVSADEVHRTLVDVTRALLEPDWCAIASVERDDLRFHTNAGNRLSEAQLATLPRFLLLQAPGAETGYLIDDLASIRRTSSHPDTPSDDRFRSLVIHPIASETILFAVHREPEAFSERDFERVERVCSFARVALDRIETDESRSNDVHENRLREVTSILSHDVKSPLNVATGSLELAEADTDSDHLESIQGALDRIEEMIDDVVTLARTGERVSDLETVDVHSVAKRAWVNVETADATLDVSDLRIQADGSGLCQIFENLFKNAVSHGGETVTVRVGPLESANGFFVEDDGDGIDELIRDEVFSYGFSTNGDHTGLGLTIVKWLVEAHGWCITVGESDAGGARFECTGVTTVDG